MRTRDTWWPTPSATWCVGPSAHQASKNGAGAGREADPRVRVADPERRAGDRLALGGDQLQPAVGGLRQAEDRHRAEPHLHLDRQPGAGLPVVELERTRDRASLGDREMAGAVVAHQDELLVEVERVELGVGAAGAEAVEQEHRDVRLQVALAGRGHAARRQQRVADDQAGGDALGDVAAGAAVVVRQPVELEVVDQPVEPDGDARRPVEDLGRDLGRDRVDCRRRRARRSRGSRRPCARSPSASAASTRSTRSSISSTSTCAPVCACTCVKSEYMSSIPGYVWPRKPMRARAQRCARRAAASTQSRSAVPRRVAVEQRARDRAVGDARPRERAGELRHAAGRAVREPLARRHRLVVERARRLQVEDRRPAPSTAWTTGSTCDDVA